MTKTKKFLSIILTIIMVLSISPMAFAADAPEIIQQPTATDPTVKLDDDTGVTYQWYTVSIGDVEITDKNADIVVYDWGQSSYDAENGWSGVEDVIGSYSRDFFTIPLKAGETIRAELAGDFYNSVGIIDYGNTAAQVWLPADYGITTFELTAAVDGNYTVYTFVDKAEATAKVYLCDAPVYEAVDGETGATLEKTVKDTEYICEITLADGDVIRSDSFVAAETVDKNDANTDTDDGNTDADINADGEVCPRCGEVHENIITKIICFFKYFFLRLFTALGFWEYEF